MSLRNLPVSEYEDFAGKHSFNFDLVDLDETHYFLQHLAEAKTYQEILNLVFNDDISKFARTATYAFYLREISREQVSTILEYYSMKISFPEKLVLHSFLQTNKVTGKIEFTPAGFRLINILCPKEDQEAFLENLKEKPVSEQCFFTFKISQAYLEKEQDIYEFLNLAAKVKIIATEYEEDSEAEIISTVNLKEHAGISQVKSTIVSILSMGAKDALTKAIYKENAKSVYTRVGSFDLNMIYESITRFGRFYAVFHPDIISKTAFHGIRVKEPIFLSIHDDLHRRFISTIPNKVYSALLRAIHVVWTNSSIEGWSKELWDTVDMEMGVFLDRKPNDLLCTSTENITYDFLTALNADVYTQYRPMGLFTISPFFDTTWLLLIDIALNKKDWLNLSIDPAYFYGYSQKMYSFIVDNIDLLKEQDSVTKQVAIMKSNYFYLNSETLEDYKFEKKNKYIQLLDKEKNALLFDKETLLNLNLCIIDLEHAVKQDDQFQHKLSNPAIQKLIRKGLFTIEDIKQVSLEKIQCLKTETNLLNYFYIIKKLKDGRKPIDIFKQLTGYQLKLIEATTSEDELLILIDKKTIIAEQSVIDSKAALIKSGNLQRLSVFNLSKTTDPGSPLIYESEAGCSSYKKN